MNAQRFVPRKDVAHTDNVIAALLGLVLVPAYLWFGQGERGMGVLAGSGIGVALLVYFGYGLRMRLAWVESIELTDEGVTVVETKGTRTVAWRDVALVRGSNRAGTHWVLKMCGAQNQMLIRGDGLTPDECKQLGALIQTHVQVHSAGLARA